MEMILVVMFYTNKSTAFFYLLFSSWWFLQLYLNANYFQLGIFCNPLDGLGIRHLLSCKSFFQM